MRETARLLKVVSRQGVRGQAHGGYLGRSAASQPYYELNPLPHMGLMRLQMSDTC